MRRPDPDVVAAYHRDSQEIIREHGFMIQGVFPTDNTPEHERFFFYYTIGLIRSGRCELVLCGMGSLPSQASQVLNEVAARMGAEGRDPGVGEEWVSFDSAGELLAAPVRFGAVVPWWIEQNASRPRHYWPELASQHRLIQVVWPSVPNPEDPVDPVTNPLLWPTPAKPWADQPLLDRMPCCDLHGVHCEPAADLCCERCTEARHPKHRAYIPCVLDVAREASSGA